MVRRDDARPVERRPDPAAGDSAAVAEAGRPMVVGGGRPEPPRRTGYRPPAAPAPAAGVHRALLNAALEDAGVTPGGRDRAAVDRLAALDAATVTTVVRWIQRGIPAAVTPEE